MKCTCNLLLRIIILGAASSLAACGAGSTAGQKTNGTTAPNATTQPTAPQTKPSSVPTIDTQWCQGVLTVAAANQLLNPPTPATAIVADNNPGTGGSCNYVFNTNSVDLIIFLENWNGPTPIPQQDITDQLAKANNAKGVTISTYTPVSGVGDQAAFVVFSGTSSGISSEAYAFYVLDGKVAFDCLTYGYFTGTAPAATRQSQLQQCAEQTLAHL